MCEVKPCLACQSDGKIIRAATVRSLIFLISCHTNNTKFYMCLCPAANHNFMSWSWLRSESKSLKYLVKFPAVIYTSRWAPIWLFYFPCAALLAGDDFVLGSIWTSHWTHAALNSEGMAISTTFAKDGMKPGTCHLCFTALFLKTCMCMCTCMHISKQDGVEIKSYHSTCYTVGGRSTLPRWCV